MKKREENIHKSKKEDYIRKYEDRFEDRSIDGW